MILTVHDFCRSRVYCPSAHTSLKRVKVYEEEEGASMDGLEQTVSLASSAIFASTATARVATAAGRFSG